MSVKSALGKITERHPDVVGAIVQSEGQTYHNLEAPYDMISVEEVMGVFNELFDQTSLLADEGYEFGDLLMEFDAHSFIVRKIENDGLLAVVAPGLARGQQVKLQVGLPLFAKGIQKALEEASAEAAAEPEYAPEPESFAATPVLPEPVVPQVPDVDPESSGFFRGRKTSRASRALFGRAVDAVEEPTPKDEAVDAVDEAQPKEMFNEDGVPLNEDGTPKKKRIYRGQVYYE